MTPQDGEAGYQEAGCGTLTLHDAEGEQLGTVYFGRMPQPHEAALKTTLSAEFEAVLGKRPDLHVVAPIPLAGPKEYRIGGRIHVHHHRPIVFIRRVSLFQWPGSIHCPWAGKRSVRHPAAAAYVTSLHVRPWICVKRNSCVGGRIRYRSRDEI